MTMKSINKVLPFTMMTTTRSIIHRYYILRHGETDANAAHVMQGTSDFSRLTEKGRFEAQEVGKVIITKLGPMNAVYVSPLSRAIETLQMIRKQHNDDVNIQLPNETIWYDLRELDLYEWEGRDKTDIQASDPVAWQAWENGNSFEFYLSSSNGQKHQPIIDVWDRAMTVWDRLVRNNNNTNIDQQQNDGQQQTLSTKTLLVCHGAMGQALLNTALGRDASYFRRDFHFDNCGLVEIEWPSDSPTAHSWTWHYPQPSQRWTLSEWETEKSKKKQNGTSSDNNNNNNSRNDA